MKYDKKFRASNEICHLVVSGFDLFFKFCISITRWTVIDGNYLEIVFTCVFLRCNIAVYKVLLHSWYMSFIPSPPECTNYSCHQSVTLVIGIDSYLFKMPSLHDNVHCPAGHHIVHLNISHIKLCTNTRVCIKLCKDGRFNNRQNPFRSPSFQSIVDAPMYTMHMGLFVLWM